ncbi:hypothetical protein AOL_s00188g312 [Orbilia oligospora ATCC 24927]|uniref:Uncharacterized protein n=1 Tax=Arthrobotrys oligospora (strain ATCC 24927 / CBS 115.81 / DSM 1491) TaxID=756982 RepID=G1XQV0_ARTOA|nr:hypothetical protein AOL_s00188g312 [Orbilia oligospora ATCC 24927]EGX44644.1 hypothetical protein AOL_s00188g312 [Orbilia oligospora ATCC 24927]
MTQPPPPRDSLRPSPPPRAQSHQSGTIHQHWNDLPAGYIPSPTSLSRSASRNSNITPTAGGSRGISPLGRATPIDKSQSQSQSTEEPTETTREGQHELSTLLPALYTLPSTLSQAERTQLQTRINKSLLPKTGDGGTTDEQKEWIRGILEMFVVSGEVDGKTCREEIVGFMRRESGVAGWAGGLRRVVESVIAKEETT